MHECLRIAELQTQIAHYIKDKRTLAHLARVCKPLSDLALDALYAHIGSFSHFLRCLPSDLWTVEEWGLNSERNAKGELVFTRLMTRNDWNVLQSYAARVITIRETSEDSPKYRPLALASPVYDALCMCPIPILFPRLRSIEMVKMGEQQFRLLAFCFVNPQLRVLKLEDILYSTRLLLNYAPKLAMSCPLMETIEVEERPIGPEQNPTMSLSIRS